LTGDVSYKTNACQAARTFFYGNAVHNDLAVFNSNAMIETFIPYAQLSSGFINHRYGVDQRCLVGISLKEFPCEFSI
jgi:hypothetical protein